MFRNLTYIQETTWGRKNYKRDRKYFELMIIETVETFL